MIGDSYGESQNVSGRLASHRSLLNRQIHPNYLLQDYNKYEINCFEYIVLSWDQNGTIHYSTRKELELIIQDRDLC
jgi:hypothetical protein